jgi:hypothetical protein
MLRGPRQVACQIVACPGCGHRCFIFPRSPWSGSRTAGAPPTFLKLNQLFLIVAIGSVLAMGIVFLFVRPFLRHSSVLTAGDTNSDKTSISLFESGQRELRDGNVHLALRDLNAALVCHQRNDGALSASELLLVESLRRQSDLLTRLLDVPLEEIVRQAMQQRNDEEWQAKFEDYRGRTVIFDDILRREARGGPSLGGYIVRVDDTEARIALDDLTLLRQIPLVPPRRWLFGARLASCRREEGGVWVIRFEPDSTVLLTEEIAAASCCPSPLDEETHAVLKRQREWLQAK